MLSEEDLSLYSEQDAIHYEGRPLSKGEIGCAISHFKIRKTIVGEGLDQALILEDDITIDSTIHLLLSNLSALPPDWEMINLLSDAERKFAPEKGPNIFRLCVFTQPCNRTSCYLLKRAGALKLLANALPIRNPANGLTGRLSYVSLKSYGLHPQVAGHAGFSSDIWSM